MLDNTLAMIIIMKQSNHDHLNGYGYILYTDKALHCQVQSPDSRVLTSPIEPWCYPHACTLVVEYKPTK
jgi:hypothetical protein